MVQGFMATPADLVKNVAVAGRIDRFLVRAPFLLKPENLFGVKLTFVHQRSCDTSNESSRRARQLEVSHDLW